MAMLEKIWPPTWNTPMGNVLWKIALFGRRSLENRTRGLMKRRQYAATKPNCTLEMIQEPVVVIDYITIHEESENVNQERLEPSQER